MNVKWKKQCEEFNISVTHKNFKCNLLFDTKLKNTPNYPTATSWKHFQIHSKYSFGTMGPLLFHIFVNFPLSPKFQ